MDIKYFNHLKIENFFKAILKKEGVDNYSAKLLTEGLIETSLRGIDSHGIRLFPHYIKAIKGGRINRNPKYNFVQTNISTGILDADHGFGHAAGMIGTEHAIILAKNSGVGFVAIKNSSHCGALAYFGVKPALNDMIGIAFTHATSKLKSPNSKKPFFGINPLCFTAPMNDEGPFCFDSAPSHITSNKMRMYKETGLKIPYGLVADENGDTTDDPEKAFQLLPIGDYKGFGLAMLVDILCGVLTGMPNGDNVSSMFMDPFSKRRFLGHVVGAINISNFIDINKFKSDLSNLAMRVRNQEKKDNTIKCMIPGDPEKKLMLENIKKGLKINDSLLNEFITLGNEYSVKF